MKNPLRWFRARWQRRAIIARRQRFFAGLIGRNKPCFDIGAYRGEYTEALRRLGARVVAVEPQHDLATLLEQRFDADRRVTVIPKALGAEAGQAEIFIATNRYHTSLQATWLPFKQRFGPTGLEEVRMVDVTTLDALITEYGRPDFIKIDVEGAELDVLRGLHQPVPSLSIEYHVDLLDRTAACIEHLGRLGAYRANYSEGFAWTWACAQWQSPENILAALQERSRSGGGHPWGDLYLLATANG